MIIAAALIFKYNTSSNIIKYIFCKKFEGVIVVIVS